jgi:hypothetical protein
LQLSCELLNVLGGAVQEDELIHARCGVDRPAVPLSVLRNTADFCLQTRDFRSHGIPALHSSEEGKLRVLLEPSPMLQCNVERKTEHFAHRATACIISTI